MINWVSPPLGKIKLNIDGCSKGDPGQACAGGILRNEKGEWILGFVVNLGVTTVTQAELRALWVGIRLSKAMTVNVLEI